jgi:hypothetical protein
MTIKPKAKAMMSQEITKALNAHNAWKQKLADARKDGRSDDVPETVAADNLCDFGRWLDRPPTEAHNSAHFKNVRSVHAAFHREAANVLRLALSGQKAEAEKCLRFGGLYNSIASELACAMTDWKNPLEADRSLI